MATVVDLSGNKPTSLPTGVDHKYEHVNRIITGTPIGAEVPQYPGELVLDDATDKVYRGTGTTINDWVPVNIIV
jgi:hypothetical protein